MIKYNKPIKISTKAGNTIVMPEYDYNNIMNAINHTSNEDFTEEIIRRANGKEEYVNESEVKW